MTRFAAGPGPGLDDAYALAFADGVHAPAGLHISGDTDGEVFHWGRFDSTGTGIGFSMVAGVESIAFDPQGDFAFGMYAARPNDLGWTGDDTISRIANSGAVDAVLVTAVPGVHALAFAPPGSFDGLLYAASWSTGQLFSVDPDGRTTEIASGIRFNDFDSNVLAFSSAGDVLYVAEYARDRVVCIEPL